MFSYFTTTTAAAAEKYTEDDAFWYLMPSEAERGVLAQFRAALVQQNAVVPGQDDEYTLLRFLKAREFNVEKALAMYLDMKAWRAEQGTDALYDDDPTCSQFPEVPQLLQVYPHFTFCTDRWGRPVYYELLGRADATKVFQLIEPDRLLRYHIWTWERYLKRYLPACSRAAGRHICTTTVVLDLDGLSLSAFNSNTRKLMDSFSKIDQDYYPEHLGTMLVINAPMIFRGIWTAVQPLLQERTRKKITIVGTDYQAELKKYIPEENLPIMFGGKAVLDGYNSYGPWSVEEAALQLQGTAVQDATTPAAALAAEASGSRVAVADRDGEQPVAAAGRSRMGSSGGDVDVVALLSADDGLPEGQPLSKAVAVAEAVVA